MADHIRTKMQWPINCGGNQNGILRSDFGFGLPGCRLQQFGVVEALSVVRKQGHVSRSGFHQILEEV